MSRLTPLVLSIALQLSPFFLREASFAESWTLSPEKIIQVDAAVNEQMLKQELVGVGIGILEDGKVAYCNGYGFANKEDGVPFTTETITNWASNSKPVVAVAALQLVEKQQLILDESIRTYLPELPEHCSPITVRHLMCHQSGYPHYSNGTIEPLSNSSHLGDDKLDPIYSLRRFAGSGLISKPGEKFSYSSYAFVILSAVVQRAGRQPIMDQIQDRIVQPLGIESFQLDNTYHGQKNWSVGYNKKKSSAVQVVKDYANYWKHGAGAYKSNILDFSLWAEALMNRKLLSEEAETAMWTPQQTASGKPTNMGLGVYVTKQNDNLKVFHGGSHDEARSRMVLYPKQKHGIVVFSNCGHADPAKISTAIYRAMSK